MNVLIISTNRNAFPTPVLPAGACLIANASEQAGHSVTLLDLMFQPDPPAAVKDMLRKTKFDVVGLSIRNIDNNDMNGTRFYIPEIVPLLAVVRRHSEAAIVAGGAALGVMPEQIMRALDVDCAVTGEGEAAFPRLLQRLDRREPYDDIPGVARLQDGVFRANPPLQAGFTHCAAPAYERWLNLRAYQTQLATIPVQTKLGCQFQCVYCTYPKIEGKTYQFSDPGSVVEAVKRLASTGLHDIEFVDNIFNAPSGHALELCESLVRSGAHARFQSLELNPAYIDHELLGAMERAGFVGMGITAESASDSVLRSLRKGFTAADVRRAADIVRSHRIPCLWIFMLGGPGETRESVKQTLRFAEVGIPARDAVFFNIGVRIYPGTELESIARREGVLEKPPQDMLEPAFYISPEVEVSWIREQVRKSMNENMNVMSIDSLSFPWLPLIQKTGYRLGFKTPLWRYTARIRRGLRFLGVNA